MRETQKLKNAKGITLIALVVTIIILMILAGVSITAVLSQNGVIGEAKEAKEKTLNAEVHEQELMNEVVDYIKNNGTSSENNKENDSKDDNDDSTGLISKEKSYVGYYADIDSDGTVDGVIFADLAIGGRGEWKGELSTDNEGTFSYAAIDGTKDYYVSQTNYEGSFGTKDVLMPVGTGKDRFYVMSLSDITSIETKDNKFTWYNSAYGNISDYSTVVSIDFGSGKENTEIMIEKWNDGVYGAQNNNTNGYLDVWGVIQNKVDEGWFVPSKEEWSAFAQNLEITSNNYSNFELNYFYASSSLYYKSNPWFAAFDGGCIGGGTVFSETYLRLETTF